MSEEKPKVKRKRSKGAWQRYNVDYTSGKAALKNRKCSRCGKIMAQHLNPERWACGSCGYTAYIRKHPEKTV